MGAVLAILALLVASRLAFAVVPPDVKSLVTAEVIASSGTYVPGQPVTVAVRLKIAPGWHVYWLNPGDSGMATAATVKLPSPAWKQSEWQLPLPETFRDDGGLIAYGYKDEVVLFTTLTPPVVAPGASAPEEEMTVSVDVVFLVCKDICLPGQERLRLKLSPGSGTIAGTSPAFSELMKAWQGRFPAAATAAGQTGLIAKGRISGSSSWASLEFILPDGADAKSVEVFPLPSDDVEVRNLSGATDKAGAIIKMDAKLYSGRTVIPDTMRALVVLTSASGVRSGRWVELPVGPSAK